MHILCSNWLQIQMRIHCSSVVDGLALLLGTHFNEIKNLRHFCRVKQKNSASAVAFQRLRSTFSPFFHEVSANKNLFALRIVQRVRPRKSFSEGGVSGGLLGKETSHTCKWCIETIKRAQLTDGSRGRDGTSYLCNEAKQLKCKMREDFVSPKWRAMQIGEVVAPKLSATPQPLCNMLQYLVKSFGCHLNDNLVKTWLTINKK